MYLWGSIPKSAGLGMAMVSGHEGRQGESPKDADAEVVPAWINDPNIVADLGILFGTPKSHSFRRPSTTSVAKLIVSSISEGFSLSASGRASAVVNEMLAPQPAHRPGRSLGRPIVGGSDIVRRALGSKYISVENGIEKIGQHTIYNSVATTCRKEIKSVRAVPACRG